MKNSLIVLLTISLWSCKTKVPATSDLPSNTDKVLVGKLVVSALCSHFIAVVESGQVDTSRVTTWKDESRNATFNNAFTVGTRCNFASLGLKEGDRFSFELSDNEIKETCAVCMAYYPVPDKVLYLRNVKKLAP